MTVDKLSASQARNRPAPVVRVPGVGPQASSRIPKEALRHAWNADVKV